MNGLLLTRTDSLDIRDNDFSYNSGLGIGKYRSSWNSIVHNSVDYNARGYSHGVFARGQDSAALLIFEQCMHNMVADNSMTHSGDGLFLWAGQEPMDTGKGGSNDNVFLLNDFRAAPTNGIKATISRNQFVGNYSAVKTHGLWGGYSYESRIGGNCFADNRIGIAIEHGQDNLIGGNGFSGDTFAIRLWADSIEPSDWGFPQTRDTRSRDWRIVENQCVGVEERLRIANSGISDSTSNATRDRSGSTSARAFTADTLPECDPAAVVPGTAYWRPPRIENEPRERARSVNAQRERSAIIVDEWGPYDWRSPKLWPLDSTRSATIRLRVLGPAGRWCVASARGAKVVAAQSGRTGDTLVVTLALASAHDWQVTLAYTGAANGLRSAVSAYTAGHAHCAEARFILVALAR